MMVQSATGQRPGSTLYHEGDGFYFRVNRQHLKTIYMRCASPGCKVTGSMASDSSMRTNIKTAGQHNHPPDLFKYEMLAFSERLYQRCRVETTPLRIIFQEELAHTPSGIRPMLVMSHYIKRMQNLRKRLRAQSLRAKINLTMQDDSVLLYEDGTPIKDTAEDEPSSSKISVQGVNYLNSNLVNEENDLKNVDSLVVEIQSTHLPVPEFHDFSNLVNEENDLKKYDAKPVDSLDKVQIGHKRKFTTHGFDWTEKRVTALLEVMKQYYPEVIKHKDNPKHVWEEVAKEIDPDVKWYTVKKKWTQLEGGYRTYIKDLKETGDQGLYRPAYLEEVRHIISEAEYIMADVQDETTGSIDISDGVYIGLDNNNEVTVNLNGRIYNSDHLYTSSYDKPSTSNRNTSDTNRGMKPETDCMIKTLLKIHKEQLEEGRKRMTTVMNALEQNRRESREVTNCIKRLTDTIITRLSTSPNKIFVQQKRSQP